MSWLEKNYEKAALGGAAVCALGLLYAGWSSLNRTDADFVSKVSGRGNNNTAVASSNAVTRALASLEVQRQWTRERVDERPVDLFVSVPLFVSADNPNRVIDLLRDEPVHPPIPNVWWIENQIDPGFENSPSLDSDSDGFSNLEEFVAGTDPKDPQSHPLLIAKLKYIGDETLAWVIRPSFADGDRNSFRYIDTAGRRFNTSSATPLSPDETFFPEGSVKDRFKFLGHETREEFNERINDNERRTYARIEDQKPNKKGTIYEFLAPLSEAGQVAFQQFDRTAIFSLEAVGLNGQEFKIEEFTSFDLPVSGTNRTHRLVSVMPEEVVVEYKDAEGATQSVTIPRGFMPKM